MPRLVCMSWALETGHGLMDRPTALAKVREWFKSKSNEFIGQNIQFDLGVLAAEDITLLPLIFDAYEEGRIHDTKIRQQLVDIAHGQLKFHDAEKGEEEVEEGDKISHILKTEYSLEALAWRLLRKKVAKTGTFRLKYATLDGVPITSWPQEAIDYAISDVLVTKEVFLEQGNKYQRKVLANSKKQHQAAWALHLMSAWGVRTEKEMVEKLKGNLEKELTVAFEKMGAAGLLHADSNKRNMKVIKDKVEKGFAARKLEVPKTPKGATQTSGEALNNSGDPDLLVLAHAMKSMKLMSTYVPILENGTKYPINASFNVLVETGRTSASRPNLQNPPRKGNVRDCFIPRPGYLYCAVDYDTLELRTLAQVTLALGCKERFMADALCRGDDLHLNLAADIMGIERSEAISRYKAGDKVVDEYRQLAKICSFGYPGGMSAKTFVEYAAGYGTELTLEKSEMLHKYWKKAWPEMLQYFQKIKDMLKDPDAEIPTIKHITSNRYRGDVTFTAAANSFFQGLAADGAKDALWEVTKEALTNPKSPLFNSHPVVFLHDEVISEVPYDPNNPEIASNAAKRQAKIMIDTMKRWVPDIPITATPVLFRRWYKGAKPVYDASGNLLPSKPVTLDNKVKWIADLEEPCPILEQPTNPNVQTATI